MKSLFLVAWCLAIMPGLRGDPLDPNNPGKAKRGEESPVRPQQQVVVTPKVQPNLKNSPYRSLPGNPMLHGNSSPRIYTQGQGQGQGQGQSHVRYKAPDGPGLGKHQQIYNLNNAPNPKVPGVKFRPENNIPGSERWQGQHYNAFRSYHSQWHDHNWWRNHHNRIILICGGWYFWDAGFWYPAWGYDSVYSYYPYDGPIYAYNDLPPDQIIANVQAALQEQGYYTGDIDGTLGPLTRAALAGYQRDHGLYMTGAIDQPTLASLGMG